MTAGLLASLPVGLIALRSASLLASQQVVRLTKKPIAPRRRARLCSFWLVKVVHLVTGTVI
jgi:hypothetical protein